MTKVTHIDEGNLREWILDVLNGAVSALEGALELAFSGDLEDSTSVMCRAMCMVTVAREIHPEGEKVMSDLLDSLDQLRNIRVVQEGKVDLFPPPPNSSRQLAPLTEPWQDLR